MSAFHLTTAIGTPLTDDEQLHEEGLRIHLADQWNAGISGIFVAGSMGMMQLLRDETYRRLVEVAVTLSEGRGEIFAGAGDTSLARTRDRLQFLDGGDDPGDSRLSRRGGLYLLHGAAGGRAGPRGKRREAAHRLVSGTWRWRVSSTSKYSRRVKPNIEATRLVGNISMRLLFSRTLPL